AVQLYATRSARSWGIGDFGDLRKLARSLRGRTGADFILLNPLGAALPTSTQENSPYNPSSRLFLNPLYLRIEEVPGAREVPKIAALARSAMKLNGERLIDRDRVFALKLRALELLWRRFDGHRDFEQYRREMGRPLRLYAVFSALVERYGCGWSGWPAELQSPDSPAVESMARELRERVAFHEWVQWHLDRQLARA